MYLCFKILTSDVPVDEFFTSLTIFEHFAACFRKTFFLSQELKKGLFFKLTNNKYLTNQTNGGNKNWTQLK